MFIAAITSALALLLLLDYNEVAEFSLVSLVLYLFIYVALYLALEHVSYFLFRLKKLLYAKIEEKVGNKKKFSDSFLK